MAEQARLLERFRSQADNERREWRRVPCAFSLHCKRLGRRGIDERVQVVDLSPGGARIVAPSELDTGDVLELMITLGAVHIPVRGLVVYTSTGPDGERHAHVAFVGLGDAALIALGRLLVSADSAGVA